MILAGPRVYFAMARDRLFAAPAARAVVLQRAAVVAKEARLALLRAGAFEIAEQAILQGVDPAAH